MIVHFYLYVWALEQVIFAIELRIFMLKYDRVCYANEFRLYERNFSSAWLIEALAKLLLSELPPNV